MARRPLKTEGPIMTKLFKVEISDAGDASLELDVAELTIDMRGNGNLTLSGRSGVQNIRSFGGGGRLNNSMLEVGVVKSN